MREWRFSKRLSFISHESSDTPPAFYEQKSEEKRTTKKKEKTKRLLALLAKSWIWRIRVSIPVLPACKAGALPFELTPQNMANFVKL